MKLSRQQYEQVYYAILSAYSSSDFQSLVQSDLDLKLDGAISDLNLPLQILRITDWADSTGHIFSLLWKASTRHPENVFLQQVCRDAGQWLRTPSAVEAQVHNASIIYDDASRQVANGDYVRAWISYREIRNEPTMASVVAKRMRYVERLLCTKLVTSGDIIEPRPLLPGMTKESHVFETCKRAWHRIRQHPLKSFVQTLLWIFVLATIFMFISVVDSIYRQASKETTAGMLPQSETQYALGRIPAMPVPAQQCQQGRSIFDVNILLSGIAMVSGQANLEASDGYAILYGVSNDPKSAIQFTVSQRYYVPKMEGILGAWDLRRVWPGNYTLRLDTFGQASRLSGSCMVRVELAYPKPSVQD